MTARQGSMGPLGHRLGRRQFLQGVGLAAVGTAGAGGLTALSGLFAPRVLGATNQLALAATDGYMTMPGRDDPDNPLDPLYIFGFIPVDPTASVSSLISTYKGHAQHTAPILDLKQNDDIKITLTNLGLVQRPDLTDSHTIHWHGFDVPSPLNDGVPEVSVAVPIGRQLTYFYRPHREGTYMYHCHFEDVEHVQMGMTSIVFVRPTQDGTAKNVTWRTDTGVGLTAGTNTATDPAATADDVGKLVNFSGAGAPVGRTIDAVVPGTGFTFSGAASSVTDPSATATLYRTFTRFAYNDGDGSTGYSRHFAILLNEVWTNFHDGDRDIQESIPTDYDPQWFTLNGRAYPQTILPNDVAYTLPAPPATSSGLTTPNPNYGTNDASQPASSLIQVNPGDRVLLRLANLGYQQHSMQLPGIPLHVVGQDASLLRNGTTDTSYWTNTLYLGPGEARDVLFDAPAFDAARPTGSDSRGNYNVYQFRNRDWRKLSNFGAPGPGGMMTEVRVYQPGLAPALPTQNVVGETYV